MTDKVAMKKQEAVHQALQAALDSWNWRPPSPHVAGHPSEASDEPGVRTELSTTVFSGEAKEWLRYLSLPSSSRFEADLRVRVHFQADFRMVAFEAENDESRWLADLLALGLRRARKRLEDKPKVLQVFEELLFGTARRGDRTVSLRLSPDVPSDGTREVPRDGMTARVKRGSCSTRGSRATFTKRCLRARAPPMKSWGCAGRWSRASRRSSAIRSGLGTVLPRKSRSFRGSRSSRSTSCTSHANRVT